MGLFKDDPKKRPKLKMRPIILTLVIKWVSFLVFNLTFKEI